MEHSHSPEAIARRLALAPRTSYLRDWVYGGIDGAVTTFAVVSGVVGAALEPRVIVVLGLANLIADGFSMAAANFLGTRAEIAERERLAATEARHIDETPEGEREEVRQIYAAKGLEGRALEAVVEALTLTRERWVDTMLVEEYGLSPVVRSPLRAAWATFSAFALAGAVPLLPWFFGSARPFLHATLATAAAFFAVGSLKSRWTVRPAWISGLETLAVGAVASGLAWIVGRALAGSWS